MIDSLSIAEKYGLKHLGQNRTVSGVSSLKKPFKGTLQWSKTIENLSFQHEGVILLPVLLEESIEPIDGLTMLFCEKSPRLIFARILNEFFSHLIPDDLKNYVDDHRRDPEVKIGENCFIGKNVKIGAGTTILHNTSIYSNTVIGRNCHINGNCSVGTAGLGFEYDGDEIVKFPQIGGVSIGDNVEIGPNTTIRRGAIDQTVISDDVKIGALSNIGHNCYVGKQCILTCQIVLGGSSRIGDRVFMGINSATKNKVSLGNDVTVGMGAMVTKAFPDNVTLVGVPAKILI